MLDIKVVEIGYFLSRCGLDEPPKQLNVKNWHEAYLSFYEKLNNGKNKKEFKNSLKNIRDHFDSHLNNSRRGWFDDNGIPDKLPEQYIFVKNYLSSLSDDKLWDYLEHYSDNNFGTKKRKNLFWKFDISTFRLLGRELITDRITAVVELVKNSYDANSKNVYIKFFNIDEKSKAKIIICDDGFGMSASDIEKKWMTIGTNSKRENIITPKPFYRRVVGEKGVGRFAIDKLGSNCKIFTKRKNNSNLNILSIDWGSYSENDETDNFQKVSNHFKQKKLANKSSGLKIVITNVHDIWTYNDLNRLYKEMAKIVSPFNSLYPPFNIFISSNQYDDYKQNKLVKNEAIKYASESFSIDYSINKKTQEIISFKDNILSIEEKPLLNFGPVKFKLYYFDQYAKGNYKKNYKGGEQQIDGIKIYRDGILATPFAEHQEIIDNKRDILGLDKRRWSGFFEKISSRDVIGILEITKEFSPNIIDSTNRQDFIDNDEYRELKSFIISQVAELEKYLKFKKNENYKEVDRNLEDAKNKLEDFSDDIKKFKDVLSNADDVDITKEIKKLENTAKKANNALKQGLIKQQEEKLESERRESMFLSLMSLQTYALEITHIIKTSLGHIKRRAEFNFDFADDVSFKDDVSIYNKEIIHEIDKLNQAIEFMSTYTRSEKNWEPFNIKHSIYSVFDGYKPVLERENINTLIEIQDNIILNYNIYLFEDIIKNLINNSVKALELKENKLVKIAGYIEDNSLVIIFSDNGSGIQEKYKEKIYDIYYTTTAEDGGNGMGLYMVKTNLEAIKGHIELIQSELDNGATFKLTFPFKGDNK